MGSEGLTPTLSWETKVRPFCFLFIRLLSGCLGGSFGLLITRIDTHKLDRLPTTAAAKKMGSTNEYSLSIFQMPTKRYKEKQWGSQNSLQRKRKKIIRDLKIHTSQTNIEITDKHFTKSKIKSSLKLLEKGVRKQGLNYFVIFYQQLGIYLDIYD